jgi:hypothetical protein
MRERLCLNERAMNGEIIQALELIRQKGPRMNLSVITNIYERGVIDYLICFAFDPKSNPRDLWQTIRNAAIDQHGLGITAEQIDQESEALFLVVIKHHFSELTDAQISALFRIFEAIVREDA